MITISDLNGKEDGKLEGRLLRNSGVDDAGGRCSAHDARALGHETAGTKRNRISSIAIKARESCLTKLKTARQGRFLILLRMDSDSR